MGCLRLRVDCEIFGRGSIGYIVELERLSLAVLLKMDLG